MNAAGQAMAGAAKSTLEMHPSAAFADSAPRTSDRSDRGKCHARDPGVALESILVATDFSLHAAYAVERAVMLANECAVSKATLLHVEPQSPFSSVQQLFPSMTEKSEQRRRAERRLRGLADEIRERTSMLVDRRVESGNVIKTMQRFASKADLVILGAPDGHRLRDFAIGSTAQRLLRQTRQPVLVVRRPAAEKYRRVLVAVDLSTDPGNALAYAQTIAQQTKLNLVHIYRPLYEGKMQYAGVADELIAEYRAEAQVTAASRMVELVLSHLPSADVRLLLAHGYAVPKLLEKERDLGADLIVVTKRAQSFATEILLESATLQLLEKSKCDVLVVR
jgi:nucleotide-binding universal stress UspA family protein